MKVGKGGLNQIGPPRRAAIGMISHKRKRYPVTRAGKEALKKYQDRMSELYTRQVMSDEDARLRNLLAMDKGRRNKTISLAPIKGSEE